MTTVPFPTTHHTSATIRAPDLESLRACLDGELVTPSATDYDEVRKGSRHHPRSPPAGHRPRRDGE